MLLGFITNKSGQTVIPMFEFFGITLYQVCLDIYHSAFVMKVNLLQKFLLNSG